MVVRDRHAIEAERELCGSVACRESSRDSWRSLSLEPQPPVEACRQRVLASCCSVKAYSGGKEKASTLDVRPTFGLNRVSSY